MILDANGRPVRRADWFETPDWAVRELNQLLHDWAAERRVQQLRNELAFAERANDDRPLKSGDTIRVRLPKRFQAR